MIHQLPSTCSQWPTVADDTRGELQYWSWKPVIGGKQYNMSSMPDNCSAHRGGGYNMQQIPDRFHLVMVTDPKNPSSMLFSFPGYIAVMSIAVCSPYTTDIKTLCVYLMFFLTSQKNAKPVDGIYLHYTTKQPHGHWWELAKPYVKLVKAPSFETYMGFEMKYVQHRYDCCATWASGGLGIPQRIG